MDKKITTKIVASATIGAVVVGMFGLSLVTEPLTGSSIQAGSESLPVETTQVDPVRNVFPLFGLGTLPSVGERGPETTAEVAPPEPREIPKKEQKFKEDFYEKAQVYLNEYGEETLIGVWEDKTSRFFHEMKPNGDIYFKVTTLNTAPEQTRELFCLGKEGKRECWTRNTLFAEGPDTWFSLEEPYLIGSWEFPSSPTKNSPEWFLARALSTVNCTAARYETKFKNITDGFKVVNTITAIDERGDYLGDQETTMRFGNDGSFSLRGAVKDIETKETRHRINISLRLAEENETYKDSYPTLEERKTAKPAPVLPEEPAPVKTSTKS